MATKKGLVRPRRKVGGEWVELGGRTANVRMAVPADVRAIVAALPVDDPRRALFVRADGKPKTELVRTTRRRDQEDAERVGAAIKAEWKRAIAALRATGNPQDVAAVLARIEDWRERAIARAQGYDVDIAILEFTAFAVHPTDRAPPAPGLDHGGPEWARLYFRDRPQVSRDVTPPPETFRRIERLRTAETGDEAWRDVQGFDEALTQAVGAIDHRVRSAVRRAFARAMREVLEAEEVERRLAARILTIMSDHAAPAPVVPPAPGAYEVRHGDRTVGELLDAYLAAAKAARGEAAVKESKAIFRAIREFLGDETPVRAVRRDDARRVHQALQHVPANAVKRFGPDVTLAEAIERADKDDLPRLTHNSVKNYMTNAAMVWNWALKEREGWADQNPFEGLAGKPQDSVRRRGFRDAELVKLFGHLSQYKAEGLARFWVPALALNGCRLSELCQLRTTDVKVHGDVVYLDLSEFDAEGRRDHSKSLKTLNSERFVPVHPLLVEAGFKDFVAQRRKDKSERLFPEIKPYKGDWSHHFSKWFGTVLDDVVSVDPAIVFHSFRHGLRQRGRTAGLSREILDAIGGWAKRSTGEKYGLDEILDLHDHLARISFGALRL
ncbi:site-specific integrase [Brevundimonas sp. WCHBH090558]|uniref:site-specific integrase n=1 Tax=Brevundimonas huaxiensis TaxID=2725493 RepID=UPI00162864E9|nr:site-specific integrase [Brevundimonas huaxiensis]MBC1182037.1 site-specific integrase [Brevundimonas huaxiensis]